MVNKAIDHQSQNKFTAFSSNRSNVRMMGNPTMNKFGMQNDPVIVRNTIKINNRYSYVTTNLYSNKNNSLIGKDSSSNFGFRNTLSALNPFKDRSTEMMMKNEWGVGDDSEKLDEFIQKKEQ